MGLQDAETIVGLDMQPANGHLYAMGSTNRLYTINLATGAATAVTAAAFAPVVPNLGSVLILILRLTGSVS